MAMNSTALTTEIEAKIVSIAGTTVTDTKTIQAIAEAVIEHITNNAVITTTVPGAGLTGYAGTPIVGIASGSGTIA